MLSILGQICHLLRHPNFYEEQLDVIYTGLIGHLLRHLDFYVDPVR